MNDSRVPRSRLNQIAQRKLGSLGIAAELSADGETLAGDLFPDGAVVNPLSGRAVDRIRFAAEGHDRLRFLAPPLLASFAPVAFFDLDRTGQLLARIQDAVARRASAAQSLAARLRTHGLPVEFDAERAVVVSKVELAGAGVAIVEGDDRGLRAMRLLPLSASRGPVSLGEAPIDLVELDHRVDVELYLSQLAETALKAPAPAATPVTPGPASAAAATASVAPPADAVTLGTLAAKLGADAKVETGLVVSRDLVADGKRVRFAARFEGGKTFRAKLMTTAGIVFDDRFDLDRFPGLDVFVAGILGATSVTASSVAGAGPTTPGPTPGPLTPGPAFAAAPALSPGQLLPVPGEVWMMTIVVEREDGNEVQYQVADIDGRPFGAPRTLGKPEFTATFEAAGNGWRLLSKVVEVRDGNVSYVQLDPKRRPVGAPRTSGLTGFLANFAPEAAAY